MGSENKKSMFGKNADNHDSPKDLAEIPMMDMAKENPSFAFAYKKTEKLIQALYLITNFVPTDEPLRIRLRERSMDLLSSVLSFGMRARHRKPVADSPQAIMLEITTLLDIAFTSGYISAMNCNVLKREYSMLYAFWEDRADTILPKGALIPKRFFEVDIEKGEELLGKGRLEDSVEGEDVLGKGIKDVVKRTKVRIQGAAFRQRISTGPIRKRRDERRAAILSLLKRQKKITVKDVSSVIENCSEKTLQRELVALVEEGILSKEGERRWSTYSLSR
ncbi:hypothetical protein IID27_00955 [Patescibacteria group bacterium]|nr:hypothetical protein [Patescibacteria group bacterium]